MGKESRAKYLAKNTFIFALGNFGTKIINFFLLVCILLSPECTWLHLLQQQVLFLFLYMSIKVTLLQVK